VRLLEASSTMFDGVADGLRARGDQHNESDGTMTDVAVACSQSKMSNGATTPKSSAAKSKQEREKGFRPSQYKTRLCRRCVPPICKIDSRVPHHEYALQPVPPLHYKDACPPMHNQTRLSAGAQQDSPVRQKTRLSASAQ